LLTWEVVEGMMLYVEYVTTVSRSGNSLTIASTVFTTWHINPIFLKPMED
jgi:hypothetical protein